MSTLTKLTYLSQIKALMTDFLAIALYAVPMLFAFLMLRQTL